MKITLHRTIAEIKTTESRIKTLVSRYSNSKLFVGLYDKSKKAAEAENADGNEAAETENADGKEAAAAKEKKPAARRTKKTAEPAEPAETAVKE